MKKRKILSLILSLVMMISILPMVNIQSKAGGGIQSKLDAIKKVYPDGSYFTVSGGPCYNSGGSDCQLSRIPARGGLPAGSAASAVEGDGWSCVGFAKYVFYYVYGTNVWSNKVSNSNRKFGDFIQFNDGQHSAIYLSEDSNYYYVFDSNGDKSTSCRVQYNNKFSKSSWSVSGVWHATNYDSVNGSTPSTPIKYTDITPGEYYLKCVGNDFNSIVYSNSNTINYEINGSNIGNYWFNFDYSEESGEYIYKYLRGITSDGKNIFYSTDLLNTDNSAKTIYYFPINEVSDESTYSIVAFVNNIAVIEKSTCIEETDEDYGTYTWYDREYYYLDCTELFDYVENELVVEPTPDDPTPTPEVPADVSGDGKLSVVDAKWILQAVANARTLTDEQRSIADVNGDGKVTIVDAKWILQAVAGMRVL